MTATATLPQPREESSFNQNIMETVFSQHLEKTKVRWNKKIRGRKKMYNKPSNLLHHTANLCCHYTYPFCCKTLYSQPHKSINRVRQSKILVNLHSAVLSNQTSLITCKSNKTNGRKLIKHGLEILNGSLTYVTHW